MMVVRVTSGHVAVHVAVGRRVGRRVESFSFTRATILHRRRLPMTATRVLVTGISFISVVFMISVVFVVFVVFPVSPEILGFLEVDGLFHSEICLSGYC